MVVAWAIDVWLNVSAANVLNRRRLGQNSGMVDLPKMTRSDTRCAGVGIVSGQPSRVLPLSETNADRF